MSTGDAAAQLWSKGLPLDAGIHRFTVGEDARLDRRLIPFDALGSAAHARMLAHAGLLSGEDAESLVGGLRDIRARSLRGEIEIRPEQEDAHTAIEALLVEALGETGKRLHLGRSRNDQVILALRLFMRRAVLDISRQVAALGEAFLQFARVHRRIPMPGYTHLRRAMPSTFGMWAAAFAAGLEEELEALRAVYARLDRCPLGAAAGFGVPLPIDREYLAGCLGFSAVQISPIDVMNSRGRHECALANELAAMASVLEKFLWDVALYSMKEFGFLRLPDAFTTGSSIMPQKRNPDVVELARGRCRELRGHALMLQELASGLPSNYHRDHQLLKQPLFAMLDITRDWLDVLLRLVPALEVDAQRSAATCTDELYAAHQTSALACGGMPFRDAYRRVASQIADGSFSPDREALTASHLGGAANPGLKDIEARVEAARIWIERTEARISHCEDNVWEGVVEE